jgi:CDP-diacylglycerol--glycerol-3-phosphate 3-phosphatidyltransferase
MGSVTGAGRDVMRRIFTPLAKVLLRAHVSPDAVTLAGTLGVVVAALYFLPRGEFTVGALVIGVLAFADALDGTMARLSGRSSAWGAFLDSTLDRISDAAIFVGLALWFAGDGDDVLLVGVTLAGLVGGLMVSYARARAEGLGADGKGGLAERTERLMLIGFAVLLSGVFDEPVILTVGVWLVALASWVTVLQRIWSVRRQLLQQAP